jgi:isoaspartyl peptidase/L-asparaginase-like protein (Ntn-hydrolase superfamily)
MEPVAIATWTFGAIAVRAAGPLLARGDRAIDVVEAGINAVELDASVASVGVGGLPNSDGVVELDALIMQGASLGFGAVAALRGIATPISVARRVMEVSRHPFLVGEGALAFARAQGFPLRELSTESSRERYAAWRAGSQRDAALVHDTVGMVALDRAGGLAAGCSTSGLPFKAPGRVGDSPVVGAGAYCDDAVGGAAATGNGDVMLRYLLSYTCVEAMRAGQEPQLACAAALRRMQRRDPATEAALVAVDRSGRAGAAAIGRAEFPFALWTGAGFEARAVPSLQPDRPRDD